MILGVLMGALYYFFIYLCLKIILLCLFFVPIIGTILTKSKAYVIFPVTFDFALTRLNACVMYGRLSVYIAWAGVRSVQPVEACESCMTSITCFVKLNRANRAARPTQHDNEAVT